VLRLTEPQNPEDIQANNMHDSKPTDAVPPKVPEYFPIDRPWEDSDGLTHLIGMRCSTCGTKAFPARGVCSNCCAQSGLESVRFSARGTLYTYSEVHVAPKDFSTPYVIGFVDLEDGVRVFGQIEGPANALKPDQTVEMTTGIVRTRANGTPVISYKFRGVQS
jgi:uncharacterized OB-fold protein